ncbi:endoplasmic reticulum-Golgi intermediate compartment protein [Paracoccidioides lutzii Pb01]|uniref:Endoplasmic reticulum-Golgi intermediate compartment protein n=1 Tax=Paracoccidioides lutzii (strain ATCC MYA-826 / Pb01) TaxID=502779 RepID=C1GQK9_PARBA|nr:endoplasmic reticulum-Golgi intermediate compartment protein [Paracoccidioides lutzii Pb01]EEH37883.1 endoplasmic reticulum-Golgi intermediate compartment protein [Paracoccidioides lutzii Pb01]
MAPKSRFARLDAFTKTVEDARIRTRSGGLVTIVALFVISFLIWGEWYEYRRIVVLPELVVDKGRGERMEIHLNITFPHLPCELLTLDVMDVSGEMQSGVIHGISKVRLAPESEGGHVIDTTALVLHTQTDAAKHLDPDYCGPCYGAPPPPHATKPGCCSTCEEVREAYASQSWAFGRGENVEQCEREGYSKNLDAQRNEGCRIEGVLRVNKVIGNFHIAPGRSFSNGNLHAHDLDTYYHTPVPHYMAHKIHQLRFGPQLPDEISSRWKWTDHHHTNPLDNTSQHTTDPRYNFMYFVKVVSTSYLPLGWSPEFSSSVHETTLRDTPLGKQGVHFGSSGSIETHQYSVTSHKRSIDGGDDAAEGHKERLHSQGGIPGVFVNYDISPMKVINREARTKTFSGFLTGVCAVIGGTLTVAAAVDRALYEGAVRVKKLHKS